MKNFVMMALFVATVGRASAQTLNVANVNYFPLNSVAAINEGKEVRGYSLFYKVDKADSKNDNYILKIVDENLNPVKSIDVLKPRKEYLIANCFNGVSFGYLFYNPKKSSLELDSYDKSLTKLGTKVIEDVSKMERIMIEQSIDKDQEMFSTKFFPVTNKGFLRSGLTDNGKGFVVDFYDNKMETKWTYSTPDKADDIEMYVANEVTDKYVIGTTIRRPGMMSKKMTYYVTVFGIDEGKKLFDIPVSNDNEQLSLNNMFYDSEKNEIVLFGDYYNLKDKAGIGKSLGFYIKRLDIAGKEVNKKLFSWSDANPLLTPAAKQSLDKGYMNYAQKVLRGSDGKFYLLCEQFKRTTDGWGVANNVLSGGYGASMTKVVLGNFILFVFNKDFSLSEIKMYEKDPSNVTLPPGGDFYGAGLTGLFVKWLGGFDYQFAQSSNDLKSFNIVYINYDKEKGEKTKKIVGNIFMGSEGKVNIDKVDMTSSALINLYPAKKGSFMVMEYLKKEKKIDMKLVKLNY